MARGENNEATNVPAASAPAAGAKPAAAGGARGAEVGADGADDGRRPGRVGVPGGGQHLHWVGTIAGSAGTAYEGTSYRLGLSFTSDYPYKPPKVRFDTPCFHPNVDVHGNICLDILQDKWSSAYDVRTILLSIQSLLGEPNNDSPLNTQAAALWTNQEEFRKMVERSTSPQLREDSRWWMEKTLDRIFFRWYGSCLAELELDFQR
ncbi:hypothetical protein EJB05_48343, partial [Eragrostis curvula]